MTKQLYDSEDIDGTIIYIQSLQAERKELRAELARVKEKSEERRAVILAAMPPPPNGCPWCGCKSTIHADDCIGMLALED